MDEVYTTDGILLLKHTDKDTTATISPSWIDDGRQQSADAYPHVSHYTFLADITIGSQGEPTMHAHPHVPIIVLRRILTADGRRQTADGRRQTADGRRDFTMTTTTVTCHDDHGHATSM